MTATRYTLGMTQPTAAILAMLERRERAARKAYREADADVQRAEHEHGYRSATAVLAQAQRARTSARLFEAQEALAEARRLAAQ